MMRKTMLTAGILAILALLIVGCDTGNGAPTVDRSALNTAIAAAQTALDNTVASADGTDVSTTDFWTTQAVRTTFQDAVTAATTVRDNTGATQIQVDSALGTLVTATGTFNSARSAGTLPAGQVSRAGLNTAITDANTLLTDTRVSADGADIPTTAYWTTQTVRTTFQNAVTAATTVRDNAGATQTQVDSARDTLVAATGAFNTARRAGTQTGGNVVTNPIVGTWEDEYIRLVFSTDAIMNMYVLYENDAIEILRAGYAISDNNITITTTHVSGEFLSEIYIAGVELEFDPDTLYDRAALRATLLDQLLPMADDLLDFMLEDLGYDSLDDLIDELLDEVLYMLESGYVDFAEIEEIMAEFLYEIDFILGMLNDPAGIEDMLLGFLEDEFGISPDMLDGIEITGIIEDLAQDVMAIIDGLDILNIIDGIGDMDDLIDALLEVVDTIRDTLDDITDAFADAIVDAVLGMIFMPIQGTFTVTPTGDFLYIGMAALEMQLILERVSP